MSKESRKGYEFTETTKKAAVKDTGGKSATGETGKLEHHHLLPIAKAKAIGIPPEVVKQKANDVVLVNSEHKQVHREIRKWSKEEQDNYFLAVAEWLLSIFSSH